MGLIVKNIFEITKSDLSVCEDRIRSLRTYGCFLYETCLKAQIIYDDADIADKIQLEKTQDKIRKIIDVLEEILEDVFYEL